MSLALLVYAVAGVSAIALMVGAIVREGWYWARHGDPGLTVLPAWYAAALALSVAIALLAGLAR